MGRLWVLALTLTIALAVSRSAEADECRPVDERGRAMDACFDPGNRLHVSVTTSGVAAGATLRSAPMSQDGEVTYRLRHDLPSAALGPSRAALGLYELTLVRHAASGHLTLATNPPVHVALPFDVGLYAALGRLEWRMDGGPLDASLVTLAPLADFARSRDHRFRLAIGPLARWDATLDRRSGAFTEHRVAPFTMGLATAYAESRDGLTSASLRVEGGASTSSEGGTRASLRAAASAERVFLAVNDHPISLYGAGGLEAPGPVWRGEIGLRVAVLAGERR